MELRTLALITLQQILPKQARHLRENNLSILDETQKSSLRNLRGLAINHTVFQND